MNAYISGAVPKVTRNKQGRPFSQKCKTKRNRSLVRWKYHPQFAQVGNDEAKRSSSGANVAPNSTFFSNLTVISQVVTFGTAPFRND